MAAELMLINPRRRKHRRKARVTHARRNPRRRRRHMSALQEAYFGKRSSRHRSRRRGRRVIRAHRNPRRRRHYTVMRRNPSVSGNPVGFVSNMIIPAAIGAVGGVGVNYIFNNYAPASLQTGVLNPISRLALAALLGIGVGAVTDSRTGGMVAAGAMTVTAYDMITNFMNGQSVFQTSGQQQGGQGQGQMGRFLGRGMGRIVNQRGFGYMNPARQLARFG
jgi:hypothetical protein